MGYWKTIIKKGMKKDDINCNIAVANKILQVAFQAKQ